MLTKRLRDLERQAEAIEQAANNKANKVNVNSLMNMNDMYYVGNIVDVDGNGWVTKAEAQAILDEVMGDDNNSGGYGDESPDEYKRMMASVGKKI